MDDRSVFESYADFTYFTYLRFCGEEALRWLAESNSDEIACIRRTLRDALKVMRQGNLGQASDMLEQIGRNIQSVNPTFSTVSDLIQRQYLSARAYLLYLSADLESAKTNLALAHEYIRRMASVHVFLIPVTIQCIDIYTQLARVARRENQWRQVQHYLNIIGDIWSDRIALCTLDSGKELRLSDLGCFFAALPLDEDERRRVSALLGEGRQSGEISTLLEELIFTLPDFVIPYP